MDLDKIVTDLLEKRLKDELQEKVSDAIDSRGGTLLAKFINQTMEKIVLEMEEDIKKAIRAAIEVSFKKSIIIPDFNWNVKINLPSYELRKELDRREKAELSHYEMDS